MRTITVSEFKATCLKLLDDVGRNGETLVITRRGVPIAQVGPLVHTPVAKRKLGGMAGMLTYHGDIVGPVVDPEEWEALR
jgi:antitoxin (DNA-binding transcriptional repressor) of toxin-antitoxin stability system